MNIRIELDEDSSSPREWDNLGTMVCVNSKYGFGEESLYGRSCYHSRENFEEALGDIREREGRILFFPLTVSDRSGELYTGHQWCVPDGFIFVPYATIFKEYGWKRVSRQRKEKIESYLQGEIDTYNQWATGDVWWYCIEDEDGEHLDSCGGFFGRKDCEEAVRETLAGIVDDLRAYAERTLAAWGLEAQPEGV